MLQRSSTNLSLPDMSDAKRALLQKCLQGNSKQALGSPRAIRRRTSEHSPHVSFAQERLWFLDQLMPGSPVFNVPIAIRLSNSIDELVLERSLNEIVRRHEVLRTTFATVNGQPVPIVLAELKVGLQVFDLTEFASIAFDREAEARRLTKQEAELPFDLANGPLIRAGLIRLDVQNHVLLVTTHHISSDGWSLVVFFQELSRLYEAFSQEKPASLNELPIQYADYAAWQRDWLQGDVLERQLRYWREQLGGDLPVLDLPTDRPRPSVQSYAGAQASLALSEKLTDGLMTLSQRNGASLFMTLLAAFKVLLYRHTGQDDIVVGSPIANRPQTETEELIGFFLNNLALRTNLGGNPTFQELLARVRKTALDAYAHQDVPFEKLIEELKPARDQSRTTIFQVYFNFFNFADEIKLPGSSGEGISFFEAWSQSDENLTKFDLTLYAGIQGVKSVLKGGLNFGKKIKLALVYNTDLFDEASITRMLGHFRALLEGIVANQRLPISDYALLPEPETAKHFKPSNRIQPTNPFTRFDKGEIEQSIPDRFAAQVKKYSQKTAVKSKNYEWSYEELNRAADRVARAILNLCGEGQERVALLFEHDAPMIAGLLGTLKAGKTYVPLDPSCPQERLAYILDDSQPTALLTNSKSIALGRELTRHGLRLINIDSFERTGPPRPNISLHIAPRDLAYLLYTSGSTGQPKGVMQNHRNVLHYIRAYTNNLHINADDRLTLLSSYCFDAAVMDIYGALLNGATLYPVDLKEEGLAGLSECLSKEEITIYHSTPTVYRYFMKAWERTLPACGTRPLTDKNDFPGLRLVVLGGEEVTRSDIELYRKHFSEGCFLVNGLGPTEATVSLQYFIDKQMNISGERVPVGYPVEDTEILLLNEAGQPAEIHGEIAIRCKYVALGYWRNRKATEAAFTARPESARDRVYRTGDMGRRLPNGSIVFAGRKDSQIKIRGFRVELGEIESALGKHPSVRETVVVHKQNESENSSLVAYVVLNPEQAASEIDLRGFLQHKLPEYMLPAAFVVLDSLPVTASGKLNRRALPDPKDFTQQPKVTSALPQTTVEKLLAKLWSDLLNVNGFGIKDNFFELGGHSLLAVRLFAQIEKYFGKRLPLATLFQAPTVAQLAEIIQRECTPRWSSLVPIQPTGSRPPFFCVHAKGGNVLEYYDLAQLLGADQPFFGLQSQGLDAQHAPHTRIADMAAHYIKEMREIQPAGPYLIGGRSMGGTIAFEMACQLQETGEQVGLLALLDTYPAGYVRLLAEADTIRSRLDRLAKRISCHYKNILSLSLAEQPRYLAEKLRYAPVRTKTFLWRRLYRLYQKLDRPLPRLLRDVKEFNSVAAHEYVPRVFEGQVTLFWASSDLRASFDLVAGWRVLAGGGVDVHKIAGNHLNLIKEPYVTELAMKLQACLERAHAIFANKLKALDGSSVTNHPSLEALGYQQIKKAS